MKLQHRRPRLTGPRQTQTGLLCLFFAAGILAGFLARRIVKSDDLSALGSYVSSYASLTVQQPADIISVLWAYLRYPAAAFLPAGHSVGQLCRGMASCGKAEAGEKRPASSAVLCVCAAYRHGGRMCPCAEIICAAAAAHSLEGEE